MTKAQWQAHYRETGHVNVAPGTCAQCDARRKTKRANARRRFREDAYRSCGLVKVRGAVSGGTYWE